MSAAKIKIQPNVLVLEDSPTTATSLEQHISRLGVNVQTATMLEQVLHLAGENDFAAALVDVRLDGNRGNDGIDIARQLHSINSHTRIFLYSSYVDNTEVHERLRNLGLEQFPILSKTVQGRQVFSEVLREALDAYSSDRATERSVNDPQTPLVRLDTIDLALYRAIQSNPELLRTMNWRKFEKLLADVLETLEYEIELRKGTKDGGIDIIAVKRSEEWGDHRYLLQAKRWKNRVGVEPVQRLLFLKNHLGATKCCLATTSTFTRGAWALGRDYRWELELRDHSGLRKWIEKALQKKIGVVIDDI